ncbi:glyoxalase/bleomycin resistance protein/dioxygenase superfamily protein [Kribbella orskensis]|uniref:Glyoxalase/bleomycin resistance protein/dioxygenase superfamily protein n=1 Tax=Kribbella orskensis TaxID=2512216 RepID=A0ABY2BG90_9ACTN|nr:MULTISPECIES: VOC family protein [Kribbella]TCM38305.1 glyoxalase/bleomycin resistance protein/dioxygenase superfamily protein [Kribbella sp. VKM Ac-2568]TCN35925.1 glyoxalase/bleomycin resistance protein/dioxygenase superfamily protein [Kribbella sp. VKM Ac-2500]TCO17532.1 glyoxalase/bleomycin resistance protein/dioxygenase superfamily protein [Kribbella orskensis]
MERKAFPVLYVANVRRSVEFFGLLGYESRYQFPLEGDPHYVGLERGESSLGIADSSWPEAQLGITVGTAPRFELFVYVDDVEAQVETFRTAGYAVLQEPATMPWGERQAYVSDPDNNPIALATPI